MTNKEAKELMEEIVVLSGEDMEKALKKQVPTKPKERNGYYFCNSCGCVSELMWLRFSFCPSCGQKQDWSDIG